MHLVIGVKKCIAGVTGNSRETRCTNGFQSNQHPSGFWSPRMQPCFSVFISLMLIYVCKCTFGRFLRLYSQCLSLDNYCIYILSQYFQSYKEEGMKRIKCMLVFVGASPNRLILVEIFFFPFFSWSVICIDVIAALVPFLLWINSLHRNSLLH